MYIYNIYIYILLNSNILSLTNLQHIATKKNCNINKFP